MRWYISRELSDNCTAPRNQPRQTVKKDIAPCKYRCDAPMKFRVSANGIGIIGQFHFFPCTILPWAIFMSPRNWVWLGGIRCSSYLHVFHFECTQIYIL